MDTIKQRIKGVPVTSGPNPRTVEVRRMVWKPAKEFFRALTRSYLEFLAAMGVAAHVTPETLVARLTAVIGNSEELITLLLTRASNLSTDEVDALEIGDVLRLIDTALEINLDEETKNSFAGIVAKVSAFLPARDPKAPKTS